MFEFISLLIILVSIWWSATIWCAVSYRRNEDASSMLLWLPQISGLAIAVSVLLLFWPNDGGFYLIFFVAAFPPLMGFFALYYQLSALLLVLGVLLLALFGLNKRSKPVAPVLATMGMIVGFALAGGPYFDRQMCASAAELGLHTIERAPFWHNVARKNSKSGREPYAIASRDGVTFDWSYDRETFVPYGGQVPDWADMTRFEPLNCR